MGQLRHADAGAGATVAIPAAAGAIDDRSVVVHRLAVVSWTRPLFVFVFALGPMVPLVLPLSYPIPGAIPIPIAITVLCELEHVRNPMHHSHIEGATSEGIDESARV
jgi:hypothetical protein